MPQARSEWTSDLTEQQWKLIKNLLPSPRRGGRPRTTEVRQIINAIFYLNRQGCTWRGLPPKFPPWQTVYTYLRAWRESGVLERINAKLNELVRVKCGKRKHPSIAIIDSQSVKATSGELRGFDGHKKVLGRKRHVVVDTLGLAQAIKVHPASEHDGIAGAQFMKERWPRFHKNKCEAFLADSGYLGTFEKEMFATYEVQPDVPKRRKWGTGKSYDSRKLKPQSERPKKRWIVERTFAWLGNYRRLSRDYERKVQQSEAMLRIALIQIALRKLSKPVRWRKR